MAAPAPSTPRPAATVVLVRDIGEGVETYLLRRAATMAFAPSMHVFPGGKVDDSDFSRPVRCVGMDDATLARRSNCDPELARALISCAVRETEEECGVVVCDSSGSDVVVDLRELVLFDHWVTPERESRRYDVRFYIARLPAGQHAANLTSEAVSATWLTPARALQQFHAGELAMLPPTEGVLRYLATFADIDVLMRDAQLQTPAPKLPRRSADGPWQLVHAYDGSVLTSLIPAPHTREETGKP